MNWYCLERARSISFTLYFLKVACFRMLELKEKMARKEAEANATIKELSIKFETIDAEIIEEREKRWVLLKIVISFVF